MTALENKHVHPSFVDAWLELRRTLESYLPQEEEEQQEDVSDEEYEDEVEEVKVPIKEKPREVVVTPREPPKISRFVKKEVTDDDLLL